MTLSHVITHYYLLIVNLVAWEESLVSLSNPMTIKNKVKVNQDLGVINIRKSIKVT